MQPKAQTNEGNEIIKIPRKVWDNTIAELKKMNVKYDKMCADHKNVCSTLAQVTRSFERVRDECATIAEMLERTAAAGKPKNGTILNGNGKIPPDDGKGMLEKNNGPWLPRKTASKQDPTNQSGHPSINDSEEGPNEGSRPKKLKWPEIKKLNIRETANLNPDTLHTKLKIPASS